MNWRVPTPTISLASGLYYADQIATVTSPDPDATLRYTLTGSDPTSSDATIASGSTVTINQSETLKVNGWKTGSVTSVVAARTYELRAVIPTLTPGSGAFGSSQSVAIGTTTSGATLRYTTDGTEPTTTSTLYTAAITVADTVTVKARAYKTGWTASDSGYASYSISGGTVATPTITPAGGAQVAPPLVAITTSTTGATIRYTLDGSTPTASSPIFVYPFLVNATTTVKSKAFKAGYTSSAVATTTFDVDAAGAAATPTIVPGGGWFATKQVVTISGASGATLRYTLDGTDPTTASTAITSGNSITVDKSEIVKVKAWASGVDPSAVRRADFVVTGMVAAGNLHSLGVTAAGDLYAWGSNAFGQIGAGLATTINSFTPVQVLSGVVSASASERHSIAAKSDGTVWSWGNGTFGRLGTGATGSVYLTPVQVTFSGGVSVAAGVDHSLVLKSDGTVWAFGRNQNGELGDGTTTQRNTPVQVTGLTGIVAIAVGRQSSYALQSDGAGGGIVWAWGANNYGQLGDGSTLMKTTPVRVLGVSNATSIAASAFGYFGLAVGGDGRVYGWGYNSVTQLGDGTVIDRLTAVPLPTISAARFVTAGPDYGLSVDAFARTWAWGSAYNGALGLGDVDLYQIASVPQASDVDAALGLASGDGFTLAIRPDGTIRGYGANGAAELGTGATSSGEIDGVTATLALADNEFLAGDQDNDGLVTWREYLFGSDPLNPDTNGNGLRDGLEINSGGSALNPDVDGDGVPNWLEEKNGTDPFRADTDGDSVSDLTDAFPLDPTRWLLPSSNPSDTTSPIVTLKAPVSARLIP